MESLISFPNPNALSNFKKNEVFLSLPDLIHIIQTRTSTLQTNLMLVDSEQIIYETFSSDIERRVFFISVKKSLKWNHFSNFLLYTL